MMTQNAKKLAKEELQFWHALSQECEEIFENLAHPEYTPYTYSHNAEEQELICEALKATRTVLKNAIKREGTSRQWYLYKNACRNCALSEFDPDVQDCVSEALLTLHMHKGEEEAFKEALRAINNYLYSLRSIKLSATAQRTVYLDDLLNEDEYVNVNNEIDELVMNLSLKECLTPIQQKVFKLWVKGYSVAQTAEKLHLKVTYATVNGKIKATSRAVENHRAKIKNAIAKYFLES